MGGGSFRLPAHARPDRPGGGRGRSGDGSSVAAAGISVVAGGRRGRRLCAVCLRQPSLRLDLPERERFGAAPCGAIRIRGPPATTSASSCSPRGGWPGRPIITGKRCGKPDFADAHNSLGLVWRETGRIPEAIAEFDEALQAQPDFAEVHVSLGIAFGVSGRTAEAIAQFEEALQVRPDLAEAHNDLGLALRQAGRPAEAIAQYQQALRLRPDYADAHDNFWPGAAGSRQIGRHPPSSRRRSAWRPTIQTPTSTSGSPCAMPAGPPKRTPSSGRRPGCARAWRHRNEREAMKAKLLLLLQAAAIVLAGIWVYAPALHGDWLWDDGAEIAPQFRFARVRPAHWNGSGSSGGRLDYFPFKTTVQWAEWHLWGDNALGIMGQASLCICWARLLFWKLLRRLFGRFEELRGRERAGGRDWAMARRPDPCDPSPRRGIGGLDRGAEEHAVAAVPAARDDRLCGLRPVERVDPKALARWTGSSQRLGSRRSTITGNAPRTYLLSLLLFLLAMLSKSSVVMFPVVLLLYCWWKRGRIGRKDLITSLPFFVRRPSRLGLVTMWFQHYPGDFNGADHCSWAALAVADRGAGLAMSFLPLGKFVWPARAAADLSAMAPDAACAPRCSWPWVRVRGARSDGFGPPGTRSRGGGAPCFRPGLFWRQPGAGAQLHPDGLPAPLLGGGSFCLCADARPGRPDGGGGRLGGGSIAIAVTAAIARIAGGTRRGCLPDARFCRTSLRLDLPERGDALELHAAGQSGFMDRPTISASPCTRRGGSRWRWPCWGRGSACRRTTPGSTSTSAWPWARPVAPRSDRTVRGGASAGPARPRVHFDLGLALGDAGQTTEAIARFEKALRLDPQDPNIHFSLGVVLGATGRTRSNRPVSAGASNQAHLRRGSQPGGRPARVGHGPPRRSPSLRSAAGPAVFAEAQNNLGLALGAVGADRRGDRIVPARLAHRPRRRAPTISPRPSASPTGRRSVTEFKEAARLGAGAAPPR